MLVQYRFVDGQDVPAKSDAQLKLVIPGLSAAFCGQNPEPSFWKQLSKAWIPGSIVGKAGDGPGMTTVEVVG